MIKPTYPELRDPALRKFVYKRALELYGRENQLIVAVEELDELGKEICKELRGIGTLTNIAEEIADVRIVLEQLEMIFDCREEVEDWILAKSERLANQMDKDEQNRSLCSRCAHRKECGFPAAHPKVKLKICDEYEEGPCDAETVAE